MDLNEATGEVLNRHPWELSRTKCVLDVFSNYIDKLDEADESYVYINAGAGDLYFDGALLERYGKSEVHAVDIAYKDINSEDNRIHKYHYLENVQAESVDYAIMMDSLEYMENDVEYVRKVSQRIKNGGFFFFTLPAYSALFSDYDIKVRNLRRYSRKSFMEVLNKVPELEKIEEHNFYLSLFAVRLAQKTLHLPIDLKNKVTAGWKFNRNNPITRLLTAILSLDFGICRLLGKAGIRIPGLSMLVVCRKI